ncbi:ScaI family restriction endonuclease [Microcystis aeruginosa CS-573]|jgi:hypothetical protein|nr:ScaI family restriction endonuclease [Microcystis aeruginosa]MDB9397544.1 ScaI family restriction endonuclease [Microcystis aeruginosa CS-573]
MNSPYADVSPSNWLSITQGLVERHPLSTDAIVDVVLTSWQSIFNSQLGTKGFRIGRDIFPKPQIMGFLLHELIPLELKAKYPDLWRGDISISDKDIVYIPDDFFSIEVKTSGSSGFCVETKPILIVSSAK